jgi:hypothetical protein
VYSFWRNIVARVIEETITIKLSKIVKDKDTTIELISSDQMKLISDTLPSVIDEVLEDNTIIVEVESE